MKTKMPPFLLGAAVIFWGWQSGFLVLSVAMALALEAARFLKLQWEFSDEDFSRIWVFCAVATVASLVYAFTANEGPASFRSFLQEPGLAAQSRAGASTARTAISVIRWFPMLFFLFIAAQLYSSLEAVPLEAISLILQRRLRRARQLGQPPLAGRQVDVSIYFYFAGCLYAASAHADTENSRAFFWGVCVLLAWALWPRRSARFGSVAWTGTLGAAIVLSYFGQLGLTQLQRVIANYNPQWLSRSSENGFDAWESRTEIGHIGRLKTSGRIVIRVETKPGNLPPTYLREATYRAYGGTVWHADNLRMDSVAVTPEKNSATWILLPEKTNSAAVTLSCYLPGQKALLPLPGGCGELDNLFAFGLYRNRTGAVLADGPGLVTFDALYGPGRDYASPPDNPTNQPVDAKLLSLRRYGFSSDSISFTNNQDLDVPVREKPALKQIIEEEHLAGLSEEDQLRKIRAFFHGAFKYSLSQPPPGRGSTNETPLSRFLLTNRIGHCEYFATATVLLLRELHMPARYAVGYAVHEGSNGKYVVRQRDAHAWCLVWNDKDKSWHDFDTTPASWINEEAKMASAFQFLSDAWARVWFEFSKIRWGQTRLRQYLFLSLVPVLALLLYQIIFRSRHAWRRRKLGGEETPLSWPGLDSEFYQIERRLTARCGPRRPGEALSALLERAAADPVLAGLRGALQQLLRLHYRHRFDPKGLSQPEREALRREATLHQARLP
jgi:protein-glutamine gamma-glutamyltransferase